MQIAKDLDKKVQISQKSHEEEFGTWTISKNLMDTFQSADAAPILTEWDEYSEINWGEVSMIMRKPGFDARS